MHGGLKARSVGYGLGFKIIKGKRGVTKLGNGFLWIALSPGACLVPFRFRFRCA